MPKKTVTATKETSLKPKTTKTAAAAEVVASRPRVKTVKHSKAAAPAAVAPATADAHNQIEKIAYGYWEARGFQPGSPEQDWLRAEQEYLLSA